MGSRKITLVNKSPLNKRMGVICMSHHLNSDSKKHLGGHKNNMTDGRLIGFSTLPAVIQCSCPHTSMKMTVVMMTALGQHLGIGITWLVSKATIRVSHTAVCGRSKRKTRNNNEDQVLL